MALSSCCPDSGVRREDIARPVGHSWPAVTQEIYTHEDLEAQRDALAGISSDPKLVSDVGVRRPWGDHGTDLLPGGAKWARTPRRPASSQ
jgi:hypothetical protein